MSDIDRIDELTGRELDAAVAEKVMGLTVYFNDTDAPVVASNDAGHITCYPPGYSLREYAGYPVGSTVANAAALARYSDESARAWPDVLDAMEARGWGWMLGIVEDGRYDMELWYPLDEERKARIFGYALEDTRAKAVCRAALRAVRAEEGN